MADYPDDSVGKDDSQFPVSPAAGSLLRRLHESSSQEDNASPRPLPKPRDSAGRATPSTSDSVDTDELVLIEGATSQSLAERAEDALRIISRKMAQATQELAEGQINQAQFQAIYTHYSEQRAVIEQLVSRDPRSDSWQRVAVSGHTDVLREQYGAELEGLRLFDNWTGAPIWTLARWDVSDEALAALLNSLEQHTGESREPYCAQVEGGRWLCYVPGLHTTAMAVFSAEPSADQIRQQANLHRAFEQINRHRLETGHMDPRQLTYPQEVLLSSGGR